MTEQQLEKVLVGSPVRISVEEPWDFTSPDGDNLLRGSVVSVRAGVDVPYEEQEIELEVTPFEARGGHRVTGLIARARHEDEVGIVQRASRRARTLTSTSIMLTRSRSGSCQKAQNRF